MRANMNKFEGMRLGKTRRQEVPDNEFTRSIRFVRKGEYMKILGIPFGEDFDDQEFLEKKYSDMKRLVSAWKDHGKVTAFGRSMLANSMIFSRFRYYAQSMRLSDGLDPGRPR